MNSINFEINDQVAEQLIRIRHRNHGNSSISVNCKIDK